MADVASSLTAGSMVGEWTLVRKIGEGAMGVVFEARGRTGETAALKIVRSELLSKPDHAARFRREGKLLQRLDHRNVVRLLDVGETGGFPYLALGFIEGESLAQRLEHGPLDAKDAVRLAIDLLRGLSAIHDAGILHRDMKPGNVMHSRDGDWKITDFGLARRESEESIVVTRPGAVLGTPNYMSPEQCQGEPTDQRSDLYSAGVTIFHAAAGEPPFKGRAVMDVIQAHIREKAPDLADRVAGLPPDLCQLVRCLMAKEKKDRPQNARAALLMLRVSDEPDFTAPVIEPKAPVLEAKPAVDATAAVTLEMPPPAPERTPRGTPRPAPKPSLEVRPTAVVKPRGNMTFEPPPPSTPPGATTAKRNVLTPSGRVPGIKKAAAPARGRRIPWERATLPLLPAALGVLVYGISRVASREALFDDYVGWPLVRLATFAGSGLGLWRIFTGFFEVNAPPLAKTRWFYTRVLARLRFWLLRRASPRMAATALRDLGDFERAAELLFAAGFLREAAQDYQRAGEVAKAAKLFERVSDAASAVKAYVKLGDTRAGTIAFEAGHYDEAARIFTKHGEFAQAAEAWQRAGRPLEAANAFEAAGRLEEAGNELLRALENSESALAQRSKEDRHKYAGRAADLFERAGAALGAAARFEKLEELELARDLFDKGGDPAAAARIAATLGDHERASELYTKGGRAHEAAKEHAAAMLAARKSLAERLEQDLIATDTDQPVDFAKAARGFEQAGEARRAADLFVQAGDFRSAARLYEGASCWREASLCHREMGDAETAARVLEAADPIGAAETWIAAGKPDEALRILQSVPAASPSRARAVALLGDVHLASGHENEAIAAYAAAIENVTELDLSRIGRSIEALASLGRIDQAIDQLSRMRRRLGDSPELERVRKDLDVRKRTSMGGQDLVGCVIDRYKPVSLIGEGGTAWVYKAEHTFLGRIVALKVLKPHPTGGNDLASRFYAEAQAVAGLKHPNVIHVFDVGATPGGLLYMALELLPGEGLRKLLERKKRIPVPHAARIVSGMLAGLSAAHAKGIVHRDLKPENVLLGLGDQPKVVDFGIAKLVATKAVTLTGTFLGTPKYASPEQAQGFEATFASDIYAAGLVLYEILCGRGPFESETPLGFLTKHATAAPAPLDRIAKDVPAPLAAAVMRSLEKDPSRRWPDAESFRQAIAPWSFAPIDTAGETQELPGAIQRFRQAATSVDLDEQERPGGKT